MNGTTDGKTMSVQVTVQRTTTEYGFVAVLLTPDMAGDDGKLDTNKLFANAVKSATHADMEWHLEETKLDINPVQKVQNKEKILSENNHDSEH